LQEWQGAATVLTTDIGRIIDRVMLYASDDRVLMLTGEGHADALVKYLRRNVFYNDDLQVTWLGGLLLLGVYGPRAAEMLAEVGLETEALPLHHWRVSSIPIVNAQLAPIDPGGGLPRAQKIEAFELFCMIFRADPIAGDGYYLLFQPEHAEQLFTLLSLGGFTAVDEEPPTTTCASRPAGRASAANCRSTTSRWKPGCGTTFRSAKAATPGRRSSPAWRAAASWPSG
jgi:hypothetical protein